MTTRGLAIAAVMATVACTHQPTPREISHYEWSEADEEFPKVPQDEQDRIGQILLNCLRLAAKDLDDHQSDARTIASAAVSACSQERVAYNVASAGGVVLSMRPQVEASTKAADAAALTVVLQGRTHR